VHKPLAYHPGRPGNNRPDSCFHVVNVFAYKINALNVLTHGLQNKFCKHGQPFDIK
jgi:hypothetical protein